MPNQIEEFKQQSGAILYAGCVGKTTLATDHEIYKTTVRIAEILVENNIGVIHGGYEDGKGGGTMQAYAEGAHNSITKNHLSKYYNIGVPEARFDEKRGLQDRTKFETQFIEASPHMDERCGVIVDSSDLLVVNPLAGNGTLREVFTMYERNEISQPWNLGEGQISPIIFYGDHWKDLFDVLNTSFATGTKVDEDKNLFFVNSLEEFETTIKTIKKDLINKKN